MIEQLKELYPFVFRALLTESSLDKAGRQIKASFVSSERAMIQDKLAYDMRDDEALVDAERMAIVYTAIHTFENMVRELVKTTLLENHGESWWDKVPNKIQKKVTTRMEDDAKFKWHGTRGGSEIEYCDFGDLSSVFVVNWDDFEVTLNDLEWSKSLLGVLERSRNIVMHGGVLAIQDIERIGGNIRDWLRQTG